MKRIRKQITRKMRKNSRKRNRETRTLSYDPLERRQLLAVGSGFEAIGADFSDENITSELPNPEGDVGPEHFVEIGEQTFTAYNRNGEVDLSISLNQFFINAGAQLFGEDLNAPRIIYDRATERWFAAATGDGTGPLAGNWLHLAFSDTSDPTGQWQQVQFVPDITGIQLATDVSLGVDADGVYLATRNLIDGDLNTVSVFTVPKTDLFLANPTIANITKFDDLNPAVYGQRIQFASNFEASDNTMFAFSNKDAVTLNAMQITDAGTPTSSLSTPEDVGVDAGNFPHPNRFDPLFFPPIMGNPRPIDQPVFDNGTLTSERITQPHGLTSGLIESDGSVFGARTVGLFGGFWEYLVNGIHWFELTVSAGETPALNGSPLRGLNSHIIIDHVPAGATGGDDDGNLIPEAGSITYFNPSIAINESGLVTLMFNGTTTFDAVRLGGVVEADFGSVGADGLPTNPAAVRNSVFASVGLRVNGATTGTDMNGNPIYPRQSVQLENPALVNNSLANVAYNPPGLNLWGQYSSVRPDPVNPNGFFAVSPFAGINNDEWAVQVIEILPIELEPVVEATPDDDVFIVRLAADDPSFLEIEINGEVTDRFPMSVLSRVVLAGFNGADRFIIDHVNGDPTPVNGFGIFGGDGTDTVETNTTEDVEYEIDSLNATVDGFRYPLYLAMRSEIGGAAASDYFFFNDGTQADGSLTHLTLDGVELDPDDRVSSQILDIETIVSGSGDDIFIFRVGPLGDNMDTFGGDAEGRAGDDRFIFIGDGSVNGSINGGSGFNTLDVRQRNDSTEIQLFSTGANMGFNGRTVDGPIGQFNQVVDQFRDISWIRGSGVNFTNEVDSIQALNQFVATYTIVTPNIAPAEFANPIDATSFETTILEQNGVTLYLTNFDVFAGSVLDDVFNVQSNELDQITLIGRSGDDEFNFSSNAPINTGVVGEILGIVFVDGGAGANSINVSDRSRDFDAEYLVLGARISGPIEIVYTASNMGTFDVTITGSNAAADTFILQSFLPTNTLTVFGLAGDDVFIIQDLSQAEVTLFGGEGDDEYIIEQVNGVDDRNVLISDSIDAEQDVAIIAGTLLDEVFIVDLDSFESDQFSFIGVEEFGFDGRGGDDEFYVRAISESFPIQLRGGDGNDVFYISSDAPTNLGDLTTMNNDLSIDAGTGINQILISNESGDALDVQIFTTRMTGLFNSGVLNYTSTGGVFGLVDEDGNLDMENFGGIDITGSNGGNDKFQITGFLSQNSLVIDGRLGEDEFIVGSSGAPGAIGGIVILDGASDGDTYTVFLENLFTQNVMIDDTGFSGDDTLNAKGSASADNIFLTQTQVATDVGTLGIDDFFEAVVVEGLGGADIITMTNSPADTVTLSGNDGDDQIIVNGTVGANAVNIFTSQGDDLIQLNESSPQTTITALGGAGIDTFVVGANVRGDVVLDGQIGQDVYTIELTDNDTRDVQIVDTSGASDVNVLGTAGNDVFLIDNNGVTAGGQTIGLSDLASLGVQGRGGNDTFNVTQTMVDLNLDGGAGADVFNISSDAPFMTGGTAGIQADIQIEGGAGNNQLRITNETGAGSGVFIGSSLITGLTGGNLINYQSTGGQFARPDGSIGGIHIITSNTGNDFININGLNQGNTLRVESRGGEDFFNVSNAVAGDVLLDGGDGADTYKYQFGGNADRDVNIVDTGMMGVDELQLLGSNLADQITLTPTGISDGASTLNFNLPIDSIRIQGLGGADTFVINGAPTANVILEGNDGHDSFVINSTAGIANLDLFAGLGNDTFQFNVSSDPTRIDAFGSGGNDLFVVQPGAFGKLFLDGQEGGDVYQVTFAGQGDRRINTRDTGLGGFDETQVFGTDLDDRIALRTTRFLYDDEVVIFDENTERTQAHGLQGNDRFVVFGSRSPDSRVFAGTGEDNFVMNSGSAATKFDLHGQQGNDAFLIRKTTVNTVTNLFGENGNDRFNIGSTANQDSGRLGLIRGELNIFGGSNIPGGEDIVYANDRGVDAAYSYMVTPSAITPIPGPANLPRVNFAGINYNSSVEAVRLDGTNQANLFQVFASQTTRYFIDGNSPSTANADRLQIMSTPNDGAQSFVTNPANGEGFVSFSNGNEIVQFEEIEDVSFVNAGGASGFVFPGDLDEFFSNSGGELDI